jgi:hypothetical protein
MQKLRATESMECPLSFGPENSVPLFAIQNMKIKMYRSIILSVACET